EPRETLIFILSGRIRVGVGACDDRERALAEVGPGSPLGEVELLTGRVAAATATALEATETLHLPHPVVEELMRRHPSVACRLARLLAARIGEADHALAHALDRDGGTAPPLAVTLRA